MRLTYGAALLLILIVWALYAPTLGYAFVYEDWNDPTHFLAPPTLASLWDARMTRIVTGWSYALSAVISPLEPWGYHLISVVIHTLNTLLLFALGCQVWARVWPAFVCAALFAVHPIQTEAVAYISARPDLLMTTFTLLALLAAERERWVLMLLACGLAVFSKESGIVAFPLAMLWGIGRRNVPVWLFVSGLVAACIGASALITLHGVRGPDLSYTATETAKLWALLSKVIVPVGFSIDHAYAFPPAWPMLTLIGTIALGCVALTSERQWSFAVLFVLIALAPRLLTPLVEGLHEHHLMLPMVGVSLALVGTFTKGSYGEESSGSASRIGVSASHA